MINKSNKIFIVEDHPVFRYGLIQLINQQEDMTVCGETDNSQTAIIMIEKEIPDLVIVDLNLNGSSGIELIRDISSGIKKPPVLVLSMYEESHYAERVLKLGARGYIMKRETYESVIKAIRIVLKGKIYVSEEISEKILDKFGGADYQNESPIGGLTNRELEVFQLIGKGYNTRSIAQTLNLSINTINTYKERIKEKLNLSNSTELARYSINWVQNESKK